MPFEIAMYATGSLALPKRQEIRAESTYYELVKLRWQKGLSETFKQLPNMAWPDHPVA
jgi:predicted proteasome-type protease